ncbi:ABC transporter ATP-binding protein [Halobaculum sp. MBLA0147]|uniref:ABC transporter ATP-binding protein n=1 Tax=Halobaculum sp. MBLA0147 TaxID=3079934 RepID=UPI0035263D62
MSLLRVSGFDVGYGELEIVTDADLTVADGEYVTVVGPNGAGKSTLLNGLFGQADRLGGTVSFDGTDVTDYDTVELVEAGMGLTPQGENVFPDLTVRENLVMGAYTRDGVPSDVVDRIYDRFPILADRTAQKAGELSGGQRQMLAIGRALVTEPDLLVLDEPSAGLAPDLVQDLFDEIDTINEHGTAVLVVEQNAEEILRRADRGYVLTQGTLGEGRPAEELLDDEQFREQFLGA